MSLKLSSNMSFTYTQMAQGVALLDHQEQGVVLQGLVEGLDDGK